MGCIQFETVLKDSLWLRINSCYIFSNLKHNELSIIICWVISSHMDPMYFEIPSTLVRVATDLCKYKQVNSHLDNLVMMKLNAFLKKKSTFLLKKIKN